MDIKNIPPKQAGDVTFSAIEKLSIDGINPDARHERIVAYATVAACTVIELMKEDPSLYDAYSIRDGILDDLNLNTTDSRTFDFAFTSTAGVAVRHQRSQKYE